MRALDRRKPFLLLDEDWETAGYLRRKADLAFRKTQADALLPGSDYDRELKESAKSHRNLRTSAR
jgi:hypothetical protein